MATTDTTNTTTGITPGTGGATTTVTVSPTTRSSPPASDAIMGLSPWVLGVLVSLGAAIIVVIALLIGVCICRRRRSKESRRIGEKSALISDPAKKSKVPGAVGKEDEDTSIIIPSEKDLEISPPEALADRLQPKSTPKATPASSRESTVSKTAPSTTLIKSATSIATETKTAKSFSACDSSQKERKSIIAEALTDLLVTYASPTGTASTKGVPQGKSALAPKACSSGKDPPTSKITSSRKKEPVVASKKAVAAKCPPKKKQSIL